jgi:LPS-assembly protein
MRNTLSALALFLCASLAALAPASAEDPRAAEPWRVRADRLTYDNITGIYTAEGAASVSRGDSRISADRIVYNSRENTAEAGGHVGIAAGEDRLSGDRGGVDLKTNTGWVEEGTLFVRRNNLYIRGGRIEKSGENVYLAEDAGVTSCGGERPAWEITASKVKVTMDGYGWATRAAFRAKGVPLLYLPAAAFPAKVSRQSGLLTPSFGNSRRKGLSFAQPVYVTLSESADATLLGHWMERRGVRAASEFRYVLAPGVHGVLMYDFLHDDKVDDGTGDTSRDWGYLHDGLLRENDDRYWFRAKTDWNLPGGARLFADADVVSDQDYLFETRDSPMGFNEADQGFFKTFDRDISEYDETVRENRVHLFKGWDYFSLTGDALWHDDVTARRTNTPNTAVQTLPGLLVHGTRQKIPGLPVEMALNAESAYFYREDGTKGTRWDFNPRVHLPLDLGDALYIEPSLGGRETLWAVDAWQDTPMDDDRQHSRFLYDARLDAETGLYRDFSLEKGTLRHWMTPWARYEYTPGQDQSELPLFDEKDRVEAKNLVSLGLTNSLYAPGGDARRLVWLEISGACNINEAKEEDPARRNNPDRREPFEPVSGWLEISPLRHLALMAEGEYDIYETELGRGAAGMRATGVAGLTAEAAYRHIRGRSESVKAAAWAEARQDVTFYGRYEQDIESGDKVESGAGVIYKAGCWSVDAGYADEPGDWRVKLEVTLNGLGSLGASTGF